VIEHDAVKRYLDIKATVKGRNISAVAADIRGRLANMQFPLEYHAEVLSSFANQQAPSSRLYIFTAAAVLIIFLLLQAAYRSWRLALLSFVTVPAALAGGVLAIFATGGSLSLGSLIGFLVLFEIAIRNSIVLVEHFYQLERKLGLPFAAELIIRGAVERFGSIMATALAIALLVMPALIMGDIPGLEIIRPMAVVTLGGLVTLTLFSLYALPALYLRYGSNREAELEFQSSTGADLPVAADD
jgi:Cu/Ag efflux pump CusA